MVGMNSQMMNYEMMLNILKNPETKFTLLPIASGMDDSGAAQVVASYNELIMQRATLMKSAKDGNVALSNLEEQIGALRVVAVDNIEKARNSTKMVINNVLNENTKDNSRIKKVPQFEREYIDLMRDKELKNDLYVFLLEKKASSMLKLASSKTPGFIIDPAFSDIKPLMKKPLIVLGLALMASLRCPSILIWIINSIKRKRKSKVAIED